MNLFSPNMRNGSFGGRNGAFPASAAFNGFEPWSALQVPPASTGGFSESAPRLLEQAPMIPAASYVPPAGLGDNVIHLEPGAYGPERGILRPPILEVPGAGAYRLPSNLPTTGLSKIADRVIASVRLPSGGLDRVTISTPWAEVVAKTLGELGDKVQNAVAGGGGSAPAAGTVPPASMKKILWISAAAAAGGYVLYRATRKKGRRRK